MALLNVKKFFELLGSDVTKTQYQPWHVFWRLCVSKAYAHANDDLSGWKEFVSPEITHALSQKPKKTAGTIGWRWLNPFAIPYLLVTSLRSFIKWGIDQAELGGRLLPTRTSSKLAIFFKGLSALILYPLEIISYGIAKIGDLIISGIGCEREVPKAPHVEKDDPSKKPKVSPSAIEEEKAHSEKLNNLLSTKKVIDALKIVNNYKKMGGLRSALTVALKEMRTKQHPMTTAFIENTLNEQKPLPVVPEVLANAVACNASDPVKQLASDTVKQLASDIPQSSDAPQPMPATRKKQQHDLNYGPDLPKPEIPRDKVAKLVKFFVQKPGRGSTQEIVIHSRKQPKNDVQHPSQHPEKPRSQYPKMHSRKYHKRQGGQKAELLASKAEAQHSKTQVRLHRRRQVSH